MKALITQREEKLLHATIFGYCEVYYLLYYENPIYYTRNIYGRRADIYRLEHPKTGETFYISTGYGPKGVKPSADYKTIEKRNKKSQEQIRNNHNKSREQKRKRNRIVLYRLCFAQWKGSTKNKSKTVRTLKN